VYKVISQSDRDTYKFLLANRDILDEHPRKDDETLKAVRAMKPFWSAGPNCYSWINEPFLRRYQEFSDDEGLFVGKYENTSETDE